MIEIKNVSKTFDNKQVLSDINLKFEDGNIYGIVGSNGAGKSTLLRTICGIYNRGVGEVIYDGVPLDNRRSNPPDLVFLADNIYFEKSDTIKTLARTYAAYYHKFSLDKLKNLLDKYNLKINTKILKLSKGQKNQMRIAMALACNTQYILLDETLDGLDPLIRINTKKIIYNEIANTSKIVIITSHSLKEMEDMCDYLTIIHDSKILLSDNVDNVKNEYAKFRCAFEEPINESQFEKVNTISFDGNKIVTLISKGDKEEIKAEISRLSPMVIEDIRLSLEEVFVIKMNELGYGELVFDEDTKDEK